MTQPSEQEHECVFVEEQEPSGRLVLPPCLVCGLTALDALDQLKRDAETREARVTERLHTTWSGPLEVDVTTPLDLGPPPEAKATHAALFDIANPLRVPDEAERPTHTCAICGPLPKGEPTYWLGTDHPVRAHNNPENAKTPYMTEACGPVTEICCTEFPECSHVFEAMAESHRRLNPGCVCLTCLEVYTAESACLTPCPKCGGLTLQNIHDTEWWCTACSWDGTSRDLAEGKP